MGPHEKVGASANGTGNFERSGGMTVLAMIICAIAMLAMPVAGADVYARLPHGENFRNVRDFGAVGDGVTDDTQAFIRALELGRGGKGDREKTPANVYVPAGTYLISDTLIVYRSTLLAGDSDNPPTIILKPGSHGFGDPAKPRPMLVTYCAYDTDPLDRQWTVRTNQLGGTTNNTFFITVRDINLKIGAGNPGAWGIFWLVAQQTALRNVNIDAGDGQGCIKTFGWGGGGVLAHVGLTGGDYGWHVEQTSQFEARSIDLTGQRKASLGLNGVWNFALLDFHFAHTAPMEVLGGNVSLLQSSFDDIAGGAAIDNRGGSLVLSNISAAGVKEVVKGALPAPGGRAKVKLWAAGSAMVDGKKLPGATHDLSAYAKVVPDHWPSPAYPRPSADARSVLDFGAGGKGKTDDTAAIQRAINASRDVWLPEGVYLISDTLHLRPDTRLFGEMWTILLLLPNAKGFQDPASRKPMLDIPDDPNATVTLCQLFFQMRTPGGIWMDWRAGEKSMLIDTLGVEMAPSRGDLLWSISGKGGGFFENSWNPGVGRDGLEITSTGHKWMYAVHQEHYTRTAAVLRHCANLAMLMFQFEAAPAPNVGMAPYVRMEDCRNVCIFAGLSGHWTGAPGPLFDVMGGRNIGLFDGSLCNSRGVISEEPEGWDAGPTTAGTSTFATETAWIMKAGD